MNSKILIVPDKTETVTIKCCRCSLVHTVTVVYKTPYFRFICVRCGALNEFYLCEH